MAAKDLAECIACLAELLTGDADMKCQVYMPWNNLGCLGVQIGDWFYADTYLKPTWGVYVRINHNCYTLTVLRFWRGFRKWR